MICSCLRISISQNLIHFLEKQLEMIQLTLKMVDQWDGDGTSPYSPVGTFKNPCTPKKSKNSWSVVPTAADISFFLVQKIDPNTKIQRDRQQ